MQRAIELVAEKRTHRIRVFQSRVTEIKETGHVDLADIQLNAVTTLIEGIFGPAPAHAQAVGQVASASRIQTVIFFAKTIASRAAPNLFNLLCSLQALDQGSVRDGYNVARSRRSRRMPLRATIVSVFEEVAAEQKRKLSPLTDDLKLLQSGLDSLSFALIVARLEDSLNVDPFESVDSFPVTFGDFLKLYENHQS